MPDFPQPGIQFKDITPVLGDARLFAGAIDLMAARHADAGIDACVGIDALGFLAAAAAKQLGTGFVPVRRKASCRGKPTRKAMASSTAKPQWLFIRTPATRTRVLLLDDLRHRRHRRRGRQLLKKIVAEIAEIGF